MLRRTGRTRTAHSVETIPYYLIREIPLSGQYSGCFRPFGAVWEHTHVCISFLLEVWGIGAERAKLAIVGPCVANRDGDGDLDTFRNGCIILTIEYRNAPGRCFTPPTRG